MQREVHVEKMIQGAAKRITKYLITNRIIDNEQQEVCAYGMELLISTVFSTSIILGLALVLRRFWYTLFLLIPFYCIRVYAGGIHADTYTKCTLSFTLGFVVILFGTELFIRQGWGKWVVVASLFSAIAICVLSPVEDHSRRLQPEERKQFHQKARNVAALFESVVIVVYVFWRPIEIVYVAAAIHTVFLVLIAGIIKNRIIGFPPKLYESE